VNTARLRKAAIAVYLATDSESVAKDISDMLNGAAHEIEKLRSELVIVRARNKVARQLELAPRSKWSFSSEKD